MNSKTKVVNLKSEAYDIYIGRAGYGKNGFFGNPHPIGYCLLCRTQHDRVSAIAAFKKDFINNVETDPEFRAAVLALKDKTLGCFCAPESCHGDVIKEWLDSEPSIQ